MHRPAVVATSLMVKSRHSDSFGGSVWVLLVKGLLD